MYGRFRGVFFATPNPKQTSKSQSVIFPNINSEKNIQENQSTK